MKKINSLDNGYFADEDGIIYRECKKVPQHKDRKENFYMQCNVLKNGKYCIRKVHRLVAEAFYGDIKGKVVNHIDGDKTNNRKDNLEIITQYENIQHAKKLKSWKEGKNKERKSRIKISEDKKDIIKKELETISVNKLSKKYGVSATALRDYTKRHNIVFEKKKN